MEEPGIPADRRKTRGIESSAATAVVGRYWIHPVALFAPQRFAERALHDLHNSAAVSLTVGR